LPVLSEKYGVLSEITENILSCKTGHELYKNLKKITDLYDYSYFILLGFRNYNNILAEERANVLLTNWDREFLNECNEKMIFDSSPIFAADAQSAFPRIGRLDSSEAQKGSKYMEEASSLLRSQGHKSYAFFPVFFKSPVYFVLGFSGIRTAPEFSETIELCYLSVCVCRTFAQINPARETFENPLTLRERDCLRGVADGLNNIETAALLNISEYTVTYYLSSAIKKLGCRNKTQAVAVAFRRGLIN
jgi:LuxR family transcriptional regulator, quorum-sensing system regulator BjaR1